MILAEVLLRGGLVCAGVIVPLPGEGDVAEQAQQPGVQGHQRQQIPEDNPPRAHQLAGLVCHAAAPHHNLAVLLGEDDIFIR